MASSSNHSIKRVCVFASAHPGIKKEFSDEAIKLGVMLAQLGIQVSYGGGSTGLTGAYATAVQAGGGQVLGIVPQVYSHIYGPTPGSVIQVLSISERLLMMYHSADSFIALPGGIGVLEEISSMASRSSLSSPRKPVGLLNTNGYFDGILSFLDNAVTSGFMFSVARDVIVSAATVEDLFVKLNICTSYPKRVLPVTGEDKKKKRKRDEDEGGVDCTLTL